MRVTLVVIFGDPAFTYRDHFEGEADLTSQSLLTTEVRNDVHNHYLFTCVLYQ